MPERTQSATERAPRLEAVQAVVPEPAGLLRGRRVLDDAGEPGLGGHLRQQRDVVPRAQRLRLGILRARPGPPQLYVSGDCSVSLGTTFTATLAGSACGRQARDNPAAVPSSYMLLGCTGRCQCLIRQLQTRAAGSARLPLADNGLGGARVQLPLGAPLMLPGQAPAAAAPAMPALRGRPHLHRRHRLPARMPRLRELPVCKCLSCIPTPGSTHLRRSLTPGKLRHSAVKLCQAACSGGGL